MGKKSFNLKYDPDTDILHVAFGKATKAISVEQKPEVFVRVDPQTHDIVGLTVLGFKENFLSRKQDLTLYPKITG
ncbi:DUF2283 domain-containing protein [Candidatus Gottesmanbacteria bacterium]|nr:DUF2283 domain-containing protein [Candidatus Gottesmanbacteria bacterium]